MTQVASAQAVKAERRQEHVAVCVVELAASRAGAVQPQYLLVQRPAQGLLAGEVLSANTHWPACMIGPLHAV